MCWVDFKEFLFEFWVDFKRQKIGLFGIFLFVFLIFMVLVVLIFIFFDILEKWKMFWFDNLKNVLFIWVNVFFSQKLVFYFVFEGSEFQKYLKQIDFGYVIEILYNNEYDVFFQDIVFKDVVGKFEGIRKLIFIVKVKRFDGMEVVFFQNYKFLGNMVIQFGINFVVRDVFIRWVKSQGI